MNATAQGLQLHIPRPGELWFYRRMLSDPATMAYNAPWFPPDGCISLPDDKLAAWYDDWIGRAPTRFYAYLQRSADGAFVGDVNYHCDPGTEAWEIGILIFAPERGRGYGREGLELLLDRTFRTDGVPCLRNEFERSRAAAYRIHRAAGFREAGVRDGLVRLELTREEYLNNRGEGR